MANKAVKFCTPPAGVGPVFECWTGFIDEFNAAGHPELQSALPEHAHATYRFKWIPLSRSTEMEAFLESQHPFDTKHQNGLDRIKHARDFFRTE